MGSNDKARGGSQSKQFGPLSVTTDVQKRWDEKISFLLKYGPSHMAQWEREFLGNIKSFREQGGILSSHQSMTLNKVFAKVSWRVG